MERDSLRDKAASRRRCQAPIQPNLALSRVRIAALEPAMVVYRQFGGNPHERVVAMSDKCPEMANGSISR